MSLQALPSRMTIQMPSSACRRVSEALTISWLCMIPEATQALVIFSSVIPAEWPWMTLPMSSASSIRLSSARSRWFW